MQQSQQRPREPEGEAHDELGDEESDGEGDDYDVLAALTR